MFDVSTTYPHAIFGLSSEICAGIAVPALLGSIRSSSLLAGSTVQQIEQVLIPVEKVSPGMFPSERAVMIRSMDNRELTLFVDERLIEVRGQKSYLRVTRVETDPAAGISVCLLPGDAAQGTRWVRIRNAAVLEAA